MDVIGKPISRVDGPLKVTGRAVYAGERQPDRTAHGVLVGSAVSKGRLASVDTAGARAAPGVALVLTHRDMPALGRPGNTMAIFSMPGEDRTPLLDERIHHAGQHIALVVADTLEQASHAASLVRAEYEEETPATGFEPGHEYAIEDFLGMEKLSYSRGDAGRGFTAAPFKVDATYATPVEHHNAMEPHATLAYWEGPRRLVVHDATQAIMGTSAILAGWLGLAPDEVRVVCPFVGGGFGNKGFIWGHTLLAAVAARLLDRPVKIALSRRQTFTSTGHRARTVQRIALGAGPDGALAATCHDTTTHQSEIGEFSEPAGLTTRLLYACPNVAVAHSGVRLNIGTPTAMRAPGESTGTYALECALDELAHALGLDPVELRIRNHTGEDPASGRPFSSKHLLDCYRIGAEAFGWPRRTPAPRSMRDGRWLIGLGMATATYPGYRLQASARARLLADGTAVVESATQDLGTGTYTTMTQVAAETLGIAPERVTFSLGDSSYPPAPTAGGSNTTASLSPAVLHACTQVRDEALKLAAADPASPLHGLAPAQVASGGGRLSARSDPARGESYEEILRRAGRPHLEACVGASPFKPEEQQQAMQSQGKPGGKTINAPCIPVKGMEAVDGDMERYAFQSFGAQFVEVRVDEALGTVRVARVTSVQDVGRVMNHKTARSQVIGGIVFGLGMALAEETFYDPSTGRPVTRNLADYHIPCNADVPEIEVRFIDEPDPRFNPLGARGLGEIGITGVAAAVANAVYHATDRRVRDLPITPDKVRG